MIEVQNLSKRYGGFTAVDNISFRVERGRIVGFLGPNGAGKTTTMRVLTCFLPPSHGTVTVAGHDVLEAPMEVKKRVGYLPETPPLYPDMPVEGYLRFVGEIKGIAKSEAADRVEHAMRRCAILDVRTKLIAKLSKGYRQRVGLAQALLHDPELLILDEPTSGLDPKQILETRDLIRALAGDHTIILSTHILPEVEQTCQDVIIINKGKVVATDSVVNLRNRLRGTDAVSIEIATPGGDLNAGSIQAELAALPGVGQARFQGSQLERLRFEVEALPEENVRPQLAAHIVGRGWHLFEMKSISYSLEEIFLQVTRTDAALAAPEAPDDPELSEAPGEVESNHGEEPQQ